MTEQVMLTVAPDALAAAIAGTLAGERWEYGHTPLRLSDDGTTTTPWAGGLPLSGWRRVEEPVRCPRCGGELVEYQCTTSMLWHYKHCDCGLVDTHGYKTLDELEAARNRIGSPWRRPTEMPESGRRIAVLWADGAIVAFIGVHAVIDIWSHASAWCYLEPPPWVEEGSHGH